VILLNDLGNFSISNLSLTSEDKGFTTGVGKESITASVLWLTCEQKGVALGNNDDSTNGLTETDWAMGFSIKITLLRL